MIKRHRDMLSLAAGLAVLMPACAAAWGETFNTDVLSIDVVKVEIPAGGVAQFDLAIAIKPEFHTMANRVPREYIPTVLTIKGPAAGFTLEVDYPEGKPYTLIEGMDPIPVYTGDLTLRCRLRAPATTPVGQATVTLNLQYQACSEQTCFAPVQLPIRLPVTVAETGTSAETPVTPAVQETQEVAQPLTTGTGDRTETWLARLREAGAAGLFGLLAIVFAMGLAMNLTPCVFPVLPVTVGFFASQGESRLRRTLPLALLYVLGMAAVFTVLGSAAALAGSQIGWALQSPWGVGILCVILAALAASLFGAFEIHLPTSLLGRLQGKSGPIGALIMGATVGLVAAPCVGPFVAALVIYVGEMGSRLAARGIGSYGQAAAGGGLFFVFALGLGSPYLVLGTFTGLVKRIPRGGGWLVWVRRLLAFPVLGLILDFLEPYLKEPVYWFLMSALALVAAAYLGLFEGRTRRPWSRSFIVVRTVVASAFLALAVGLLAGDAIPALSPSEQIPWTEFQDGQLAQAKAAGRPAVVYFTASWCKYCLTMERGVFRSDVAREAGTGVRLIKIDISRTPAGDSEKAALYKKFVRGGPPVLVFFDRQGKAIVHRGLIEADEFVRLLREIRK